MNERQDRFYLAMLWLSIILCGAFVARDEGDAALLMLGFTVINGLIWVFNAKGGGKRSAQ